MKGSLWLMLAFLLPLSANAQVTLSATRLVYDASAERVFVRASNEGPTPALIQTWIEEEGGDPGPDASKVPFAIAPPMTSIAAGESRDLMIIGVRPELPVDAVEHLYWLNVQEIPARQPDIAGNILQVSVRTRIKLLYRPADVPAPGDPSKQLGVKTSGAQNVEPYIELDNPSPNYVNIGFIETLTEGGVVSLGNVYIPPHASKRVELSPQAAEDVTAVRYGWIDDNGEIHTAVVPWRAGAGTGLVKDRM